MTGEGEMLRSASMFGNNVDSIVNSSNSKYDKSGIPLQAFFEYMQENQRQMGQLIESIHNLSIKIQ